MLIEQTEELFKRHHHNDEAGVAPAVDMLYPVAYPFPHIGKLMGMLFIPFAAWFLGNAMRWEEYATFLPAGLFAYFGGPILATPFLLDLMQLPHDMFQLFLVSGVYVERLGDALGAMHLLTFTLLTTCAFTGRLRLMGAPILKYVLIVSLVGLGTIGGMRFALSRSMESVESKNEIIARMQLIEEPVASVVFRETSPNPDPLKPGEKLLERGQASTRRSIRRARYWLPVMPTTCPIAIMPVAVSPHKLIPAWPSCWSKIPSIFVTASMSAAKLPLASISWRWPRR